jgi:glycosyltransferase involved in cell wall biosynthesis
MSHFVSIIIPCRNEQDFIADCLDSVVAQDFLKENLEVLIVDGMSEDKTGEIIKEYAEKYDFVKPLNNPNKFTPYGLNIGIKAAKGDVVIRMDAHARYKDTYISQCVSYLDKSGADNVGGVLETVPAKNTLTARAIAISLSHFFGAGNALFRIGTDKPIWTDTVFGGCYKREVFDKIGLFNEKLARSQDMEFNLRLKNAGGQILLVPDIVSYYYPKADLKEFFLHNIEDGIWTILPLKLAKMPFSLRHYIPLMFLLTLPISIWPYIIVSLYFSFKIAREKGEAKLFFAMPLIFAARHIGYGLGSFLGIFKLLWI